MKCKCGAILESSYVVAKNNLLIDGFVGDITKDVANDLRLSHEFDAIIETDTAVDKTDKLCDSDNHYCARLK